MAVLAADVNLPFIGSPVKVTAGCASADIFYKGALIYADATSGKATVNSAAAGRFLGISTHQQITTAADQNVEYYASGIFQFPALGSVTVADTGKLIVMDGTSSDNPADAVCAGDITLATGDSAIGMLLWINGGPHVDISQFRGRTYDATAAAWV